MKIVIAGGSGQVGQILIRAFHTAANEVIVLSRDPNANLPVRIVAWDGKAVGAWAREIDGSDVVINLAG